MSVVKLARNNPAELLWLCDEVKAERGGEA